MMGEVVGITTRGFEGAGNLNFAIPVNDAKRMLRNQSATLQDLPNETEGDSKEAPNAQNSYCIMSYNADTDVVVVRHGNQILTAVIQSAVICKEKVKAEGLIANDCEEKVASAASKMVGQILGWKSNANGYFLQDLDGALMVFEWHKDWAYPPGEKYKSWHRVEFWNVKKVEVVQP